MTRSIIFCMSLFLAQFVNAQEQVWQFSISPESQFVFLPSPWMQIDGCQAESQRCDFAISGTISTSLLGDMLTFPTADLQLVGNEAVQSHPPGPWAIVTEAKVEEVLNTVELLRITPELFRLKEPGFLHGPLIGPPLEVAFTGNQLQMTGGEDRTGGDGLGYFFDVFAVLVADCDFDRDQSCALDDIDQLMNVIAADTHNSFFDLNGDSIVDDRDRDEWLDLAAQENGFAESYLLGDSNLDGIVNSADLNALALNWQQDFDDWSGGNFTSGAVTSLDLNELALNWQQSIPIAASNAAPVPEPSTLFLTLVVGLVLSSRRHSA